MSEHKQSRLGLAALITSVTAAVLFIFSIFMAAASPEAANDSVLAIIGVFIIFSITAALVGLGLGIGGLYQKSCKKAFSISGTACGATVLTLIFFLLMLGASGS